MLMRSWSVAIVAVWTENRFIGTVVAINVPVTVARSQFAQRRKRDPRTECDERNARHDGDEIPESRCEGNAGDPHDGADGQRRNGVTGPGNERGFGHLRLRHPCCQAMSVIGTQ